MKINVFRFYQGVWDMVRTLRGADIDGALEDYDSVIVDEWISDENLEVWV